MVKRRIRWRFVTLTVFLVGAVLLAYSVVIEPDRLVVRDQRLHLPELPTALDGLKVAVIADLHAGSLHIDAEKIREVVSLTNAAAPDLILLPGDFVIQDVLGGNFIPPETTGQLLADLAAPLGVWAVMGNHDWLLSFERVHDALEVNGIAVLENEAVEIVWGGKSFWLGGVGDTYIGADDLDSTLAAIPSGVPVLVFTHSPDVFPTVPRSVALTVAGHTHGGQVVVPFVGPPIVPSRYGDRYAKGHIEEGERHLFVSTGIGTSIIPVRFLVPPEINILTLQKGRPEGLGEPE